MNRKERRAQGKRGISATPAQSGSAVSAALLGAAGNDAGDPVAAARRLLAADRPADAVQLLRAAIAARAPDAALELALGDAWCELGRFFDAVDAYERALALGETAAGRGRQHALSKLVPSWHFAMLNDAPRNDAYARAIETTIRPGDLVLEIGAGSGLLAMMAARAGAERVVTCEQAPPIAAVAREIVAANGFAGRIDVVAARSTRLRIGAELPRRADVLIMEVFDTALLGEGVIAALIDAHARLLAPGARVVPGRAQLWAQAIECPELRSVNPIGRICGFDLSAFDRFRAPGGQSLELTREAYRPLSAPVATARFDFSSAPERSGVSRARLSFDAVGTVQAVALWFELELAPGIGLATAPGAGRNHWRQSVQFLAADRAVRAGETAELVLSYAADRLDVSLS
jgi:tetratricopeptide (TPR) repeat protein